MTDEQSGFHARLGDFGSHVTRRHQDGRPVFGLPGSFTGRRWLSQEGSDDFGLAHGEPRPDQAPLITVGVLGRTDVDENGGRVDVYGTLGTYLLLAERSRNDPAFQYESRDQDAIVRALGSVGGPEEWEPITIELDGAPAEFRRCERCGDWIAFRDLGGECLWVHVEQPNGEPVSIVTLNDITPYLDPTT
jgi:hypothetical protein